MRLVRLDARAADERVVAAASGKRVVTVIAGDDIVEAVPGAIGVVVVVVDRRRDLVEIEPLILTAGSVLRSSIGAWAEEDAVGQVGLRIGDVIARVQCVTKILEGRGRADQLAIEKDLDDVIVGAIDIGQTHLQGMRRGRVDAADELAPIVGRRIAAVAAEVATGIGLADRDANAAAEGLDDQEVVAVGAGGIAEIDLEARPIRDCVYRLEIE
jgi:hypothetical protein